MKRVDMRTKAYAPDIIELNRSGDLCFEINQTKPRTEKMRQLINELLLTPLDATSNIASPMDIDRGKMLHIGKHVFINHHLTAMAIDNITIEDDVMIGPDVSLLTANHDFSDHYVLEAAPILIKRNAWIGANAVILPGITVGENAVVAGGAVVTKNVPANTVVGGNPARILKELDEK